MRFVDVGLDTLEVDGAEILYFDVICFMHIKMQGNAGKFI